ncbi:MAG: hypothetical protein ACRDVE_22245 [Actinocrinis sp.]
MALTTIGAGLAVAAAAPMASAATTAEQQPQSVAGLSNGALATSVTAAHMTQADLSRLGAFRLYPLAGTGLDPLSNVVGTNLGGVPVSTKPVADMVSDGLPMSDLPVVGALFQSGH